MTTLSPSPSLATRFAAILREVQTAEAPAVDLLAAVAPWLAPSFPMAYTWHNVTTMLTGVGWNWWVAFFVGGLVAAGVESVGISAVHTVIGLWGKEKSGGLVRLASFALGMYLLIVVVANIFLDIHAGRHWITITASAILCLMTVTGGIIAGVRARAARAAAEEQAKQDATKAESDKALAEDVRQFDKEMAQLEAKRLAEAEAQRLQREHEAHMAQIAAEAEAKRMAHELEMEMLRQATPPPVAPPRPPRERKPRAKVAPGYDLEELARWVADNCDSMDDVAMAHYLDKTYKAQGKDIAILLGKNAGTISRWLNGNGVKEQ